MPLKRLTIATPCFNEAGNLTRFPDEVFPIFAGLPFETEYLFVDDGSTDDTAAELERLSAAHPSVRWIRHEFNRGLGASIRTAIGAATGDAILTLDADLTFHPNEAGRLLEAFHDGVDCVAGSPFLGHFEGVPPMRRFMSWSVNRVYRILLGGPVSATTCIFRLYRADALKALSLTSDSFQINGEIVFKLLAAGKKIVEVPVTLTTRRQGVSKLNTAREIKNHLRMFARILAWRREEQAARRSRPGNP